MMSTANPPSAVGSADRHPRLMIKVCGMRDSRNIREVEALGIDMMGFIFHPQSPRYVDTIPGYLPASCKRVGVFVNADIDYILRQAEDYSLDAIQLHGAESPGFCASLREQLTTHKTAIIKALSPQSDVSGYEGVADMLLFDTPCVEHGGSGRKFDWSLLEAYHGTTPFMLSGGIGPDSAEALRAITHPQLAGIDLNSRFELSPAIKDSEALRRFLAAIIGNNNYRN